MLHIYNTLTSQIDKINTVEPGIARLYTCGPTVYRHAHIGNLRSYLLSDWIRRVLENQGIKVTHIKNITDVGHMRQEVLEQGEDKVIAAAVAEGKTPRDIANFYTSRFMDDEKKLNIKPAHVFPKATAHINEMTKMVSRLLHLGHAYESGGNVYFSVSSFSNYGNLSGNTNKVDLQEGVRVNIDPFKRDPRDFTLVAYGGAGPMHAVAIAEELEMEQILVPLGPGNLAAFGSLISDLKRDHVQTKNIQLSEVEWDSIDTMFQKMEGDALSELRREGIADDSVIMHRSVGMRYVGQSWELNVDIEKNIDSLSAIGEAFENTHERRFGHRSEGATEIVNFRIAATAVGKKPDLPFWTREGTVKDAQSEKRQIYFDGAFVNVAVYQRQLLPHGSQVDGPCIIEESGSTTVLPENWSFLVLEDGSLLLNANGPNKT